MLAWEMIIAYPELVRVEQEQRQAAAEADRRGQEARKARNTLRRPVRPRPA